MSLNSRSVFLLDGTGALLSMILTGLILPYFSDWLGLPAPLLRSLAIIPSMYAIYSFYCYKRIRIIQPWMLAAIMLANLGYCALSSLLIFTLDSITLWGQLLLAGEILAVAIVIAIEFRIYKDASNF